MPAVKTGRRALPAPILADARPGATAGFALNCGQRHPCQDQADGKHFPAGLALDVHGRGAAAAARSKDARKRNGACIASADYKILGVATTACRAAATTTIPAYWADDDEDPLHSRHSYIVHAEVNAILNCVVLPLTGGTIYATQFPCPRCVQSIIQVGIQRVVYLEQKPHQVASIAAANKMLQGRRHRRCTRWPSWRPSRPPGRRSWSSSSATAGSRARPSRRRATSRRVADRRIGRIRAAFSMDRRAGGVPHHRVVDSRVPGDPQPGGGRHDPSSPSQRSPADPQRLPAVRRGVGRAPAARQPLDDRRLQHHAHAGRPARRRSPCCASNR